MPAKVFAFLPIIALMFSMGFFMLGSLPLLILKHDTPLDGRFIRGLFNVYYIGVMSIAVIGFAVCISIREAWVAAAMAALAAFVFATRARVIPQMDRLRDAMAHGDMAAVRNFRRLHVAGMILNVVLLAIVVWGMVRLASS